MEIFNCEQGKVELYESNRRKLKTYEYDKGKRKKGISVYTYDLGAFTDFSKEYIVRFTSKSVEQTTLNIGFGRTGSWNFITGTGLPIRILNNVFKLAIQALGVQAKLSGSKLILSLGEELKEAININSPLLGRHPWRYIRPNYRTRSPLDVLAQQIVAEVACREWHEDALYQVYAGAWLYRDNLSMWLKCSVTASVPAEAGVALIFTGMRCMAYCVHAKGHA